MGKYLIEKKGYDQMRKNEQGNTPLHMAAIGGNLDIMKYLIEERKCCPESLGQWGRIPLHHASEDDKNLVMVKYLVEKHGCDPCRKDEQGNAPLHLAAMTGSLNILRYFVEKRKCNPRYLVEQYGCDPYEEDENGNTVPALVSMFTNNVDVLMYLIEERKCGPLGCHNQLDTSLLHRACKKNGNLAMVKYLIEKQGYDQMGKNEQRDTPLHMAAFGGNLDVMIYLIEERKCSPKSQGQLGRLPLHHASEDDKNLFMVKYLVEKHGCDPCRKDEQGNAPLHVAAITGSLNILRYFVEERKCNPRLKGRSGRSVLHKAQNHLAMIKYLVEKHEFDPYEKDEDGNNLLLLVAGFTNSMNVLMYLIEERKCSPLGCQNQFGRSILHCACEKAGNLAIVKYLVEKHGCDPSVKDEKGYTPLHMAAFSGSLDILVYLIEQRGCNPSCLGQFSRSLLHRACVKDKNLPVVKYLVEKHQCDPFYKDQCNLTPLDMATTWNNRSVIDYLTERMGIAPKPINHGLPPGSITLQDPSTRRWIPRNEHDVQLEWNHPTIQNNLGPQLPEWCIYQKWSGGVVFVNMETAATVEEDPRAAVVRYQYALKKGFVSAYLIKVLIVGAAGVGKTHLLHLIIDEPPPDVRQSTPVMERPVQAIQTSLNKKASLEKITDKELYDLMARSVNTTQHHQKQPVHGMTHQHSNVVASRSFTTENICNDEQNLHEEKQISVPQYTGSVSEVEEQLVPYIAKTKDSSPLLDVDWVYFIDSGGQPQFHQLLPAFMHHTNLNIFVLRLCDKLSDHPTVEYYDERGSCVSSTTSLLTNKQILQCCAQATQTTDQDGDSRLLIVGTHRDLEHQCSDETRDDKNTQLLELLTPSMENTLVYSDMDGSELIFPLNTKAPEDSDKQIVKNLHKSILSIKRRMKPTDIPLRWLVFHRELQALSLKTKVDVLTFEQCREVALRLSMVDDTEAAILFFSDLNVVLYYPSILPNVVFMNPQSLLNIITEIIKHIVYGVNCTQPSDAIFVRARKEGIISLKLLEQDFMHLFKPQMFEAQDLINLLLYLRIVSKCKCDYFMPSLLKGLDAKGIEASLSQHPDSAAPCAIYYENRWLECGSFGFLMTSLLSSEGWTLAFKGNKLLCVYSNCIKMYYNTCVVTFVDRVSLIEIHLHGNVDICSKIQQSVTNTFKVKPQFAYICPCKMFTERHVAKYIPTTEQLFCSKNQQQTFSLSCFPASSTPEAWITRTLKLSDLMNDVGAVIPAKWRLVGVQLDLPTETLDSIQARNAGRPNWCIHSFEQVFTEWKGQGTRPYTWETIINALRTPTVGELVLADDVLNRHCCYN
ncbi:hypothetical protein EMCRGX_G020379 [Ephydatia muelleri]